MEKSSKVRLTKGAMLLFKEGILPSGVQRNFGINTYKELKTAIDAGEFEVESTPSQAELDLK